MNKIDGKLYKKINIRQSVFYTQKNGLFSLNMRTMYRNSMEHKFCVARFIETFDNSNYPQQATTTLVIEGLLQFYELIRTQTIL